MWWVCGERFHVRMLDYLAVAEGIHQLVVVINFFCHLRKVKVLSNMLEVGAVDE